MKRRAGLLTGAAVAIPSRTRMWAPLQDAVHVEFYEEFHRGRWKPDEDWQPMVRAVRYLQAQPYAPRLFAFTSLARFYVTTAPTYEQSKGHRTVGVAWSFHDRVFHLSIGEWSGCRSHDRSCDEQEFPRSVDSLINVLLMCPDDLPR